MGSYLSLRAQGKSDPVIILQVFDKRFLGRKFMLSTGIPMTTNLWDKRKGRVKVTTQREDELTKLNRHLDNIEQAVVSYLADRLNSKTLNRDDLKTHIAKSKVDDQQIRKLKVGRENNFFQLWQKFIDTAKNSSGEKITTGTKRSKTQTKTLVEKYCTDYRIKLTLENIDMEFYHNFDLYMLGLKLNGNTRGKHFKEIKAILREAQDRDMHVNLAFQKKSFKVIRAASDSTYLNDTEIKKIFNLQVSPTLSKQRDVFVMACFVGARHSDWHQIRQSNIVEEKGKEILKLKQRKTNETVHIPIHPAVRQILDRYNGEPPRVISNQKFNSALKDIVKEATLGKISINGQQVDKWNEVSTHTARRSFATNAYLSRTMDVHQIMKCTGHRTEVSFLKYLKLDGKDFAMEAADSEFFNDKSWVSSKK